MGELLFFLKIGLLIFSVISLIGYQLRKSDSKHALRNMDDEQIVRQLTPQEKAILDSVIQGRKLHLLSDDVYQLSGEYIIHGIDGSAGEGSHHDLIGGVEVIFPFDLKSYVQSFNEAFVVRAEKQAIVIMLNGEDIFVAEQREAARAQQQSEWESGQIGSITPFKEERVDYQTSDEDDHSAQTFSTRNESTSVTSDLDVKILSQRDETPEEIQARVGRGINFLSATLWIIATILLLVALLSDKSSTAHVNIIIAVVAILIGFFLFFKRRNYSDIEPLKVNRARGKLTLLMWDSIPGSQTMVPTFFLGSKIPLSSFDHIVTQLHSKLDETVELEARVSDNFVVSLGNEWSMTEEVKRYKYWYWGRYLLAALVGIFALGSYGLNNDKSYSDLSVAFGYYLNPAQNYTDEQSVLSSPPKLFSQVHLQGHARCEYRDGGLEELGLPVNDCATVRWNGELSPVTADLVLDEPILSLLDGRFVTSNERRERVLNYDAMLNRRYSSYSNYYSGTSSYYRTETLYYITDFDKSLVLVEQACEQGIASCEQLKTAILDVVSKKITTKPVTEWDKLVEAAQPGEVLNYFAVTSPSVVKVLQEAVRNVVYAEFEPQIRAFAVQLLHYQTGGVVIRMDNQIVSYNQDSQPLLPLNTKMKSWRNSDINSYVAALKTDVANSQIYPFDFTGLVVDVRHELDGTPILVLNTQDYSKIASDALARILLLTLGLILTLGFGAMFFITLSKSSTRKELVQKYCDVSSEASTTIVS